MDATKRICIVTPGPLGSAPRVVKEATALTEFGHDVTVVSTRTLDLVDNRDDDVLATAKWRSVRIDLRQLKNRLTGRLIQAAATHLSPFFVDKALSAFTHYLIRATEHIPADLYIAHCPPALPAAAKGAQRHRGRYAFDAEDFHLGDMPDNRVRDQNMIRAIESRYLPDCAYITAASPGIADAYADTYNIKRPVVILNVFPRGLTPAEPTLKGRAVGPSVYWFSQTIGPNRGLECAVRVIGRAQTRPHLYLRGSPAGDFDKTLELIAKTSGSAGRLHILQPAPPSAMERLAAECDVGLVGETGYTKNRRIALTNKQFTYFIAGIPAVMSDIPAHRNFADGLESAIRLYRTDDAVDLARTLDEIFCKPDTLAAARMAAWKLGQTSFNWDTEKLRLLALIQSANIS